MRILFILVAIAASIAAQTQQGVQGVQPGAFGSSSGGSASLPANKNVISTNGAGTAIASTSHNISTPMTCVAASGSGTAYTCSTVPSFTPAANDVIEFVADVANTGAVTINVNASGAIAATKQGSSAALIANDLLAGQRTLFIRDSTGWQMIGQTGNASAGGGVATVGGTGPIGSTGGANPVVSCATCVITSSTYSQPAWITSILTSILSGTLQAAQMPALTGDATNTAGTLAVTVSRLNGTSLAGLATGILKNTTTTGVPSIAVSGDFPTLNQNTTGTAANITGNLPTTQLSGALQAAQEPAHTGDATNSAGSLAMTVSRLNGTSLAGLATGILKNTTTTGVPSIAIAADFPTLNQNTTGSAASFTGSLLGDVTGTQGATTVGKLNGTSLAGLATGILKNTTTSGVPSIAVAGDFPTLNQNTTGSAASFTGALAGDVTGTQGATSVGKLNGTSLAGLATGILKNTTATGVPSIAAAADVVGLFSACSGTQYLGADGACHNGGTSSAAGASADVQVNVAGVFGTDTGAYTYNTTTHTQTTPNQNVAGGITHIQRSNVFYASAFADGTDGGAWSNLTNYSEPNQVNGCVVVTNAGQLYGSTGASGPANGGAVTPGTDKTKWWPVDIEATSAGAPKAVNCAQWYALGRKSTTNAKLVLDVKNRYDFCYGLIGSQVKTDGVVNIEGQMLGVDDGSGGTQLRALCTMGSTTAKANDFAVGQPWVDTSSGRNDVRFAHLTINANGHWAHGLGIYGTHATTLEDIFVTNSTDSCISLGGSNGAGPTRYANNYEVYGYGMTKCDGQGSSPGQWATFTYPTGTSTAGGSIDGTYTPTAGGTYKINTPTVFARMNGTQCTSYGTLTPTVTAGALTNVVISGSSGCGNAISFGLTVMDIDSGINYGIDANFTTDTYFESIVTASLGAIAGFNVTGGTFFVSNLHTYYSGAAFRHAGAGGIIHDVEADSVMTGGIIAANDVVVDHVGYYWNGGSTQYYGAHMMDFPNGSSTRGSVGYLTCASGGNVTAGAFQALTSAGAKVNAGGNVSSYLQLLPNVRIRDVEACDGSTTLYGWINTMTSNQLNLLGDSGGSFGTSTSAINVGSGASGQSATIQFESARGWLAYTSQSDISGMAMSDLGLYPSGSATSSTNLSPAFRIANKYWNGTATTTEFWRLHSNVASQTGTPSIDELLLDKSGTTQGINPAGLAISSHGTATSTASLPSFYLKLNGRAWISATDRDDPWQVKVIPTATSTQSNLVFEHNSITGATYTSGGSVTGTINQTCTVTTFNGGGLGATGVITLTGTNSLTGALIVVSDEGYGYTTAPTSAVLSVGSGTASACSGTIVIASTVSGITSAAVVQLPALSFYGGNTLSGDQGNGLLVQHSTGAVTNGHIAKFDANGNTVDGGVAGAGAAAQFVTTTFSATPTFTASSNTATTFIITLTGNVTSSTLSGASSGQIVSFRICQDATGSRTFVWPTTVLGAGTIGSTLSTCSNQDFRFDGTNANAVGNMYVTGATGDAVTFNGSSSGTTTLQPTAVASGTVTLPAATTTLVGTDTTDTLTNKSIAGSEINSGTVAIARLPVVPDLHIIPAANCVSTVAGSGWNTALTPTCIAGTNNLGGYLPFVDTSTAQFEFELPADWDSTNQPYIAVFFNSGSNTTGTVIFNAATACTKADGSITSDPAFATADALTTKTMAAATRAWSTSVHMTQVTSGNNCVAGGTVLVKITRATDTASTAVQVTKATITVPRQLVIQAN